MKLNKYLLILFLVLTACVSTRPAKNIDKAENKIIKFNKGIKNQVDKYPELVDKAFRVVIKDTIVVEGDSVSFDVELISKSKLDSLNKTYKELLNTSNKKIDSLINLPLIPYEDNCQEVVNQLLSRIAVLKEGLDYQKNETTKWFENYQNIVLNTIDGTYKDEKFTVHYSYYNGNITIKPTTNDKYIVVDKEEYNYNVKIKKNFWQDIKFYPFIIILVAIFYFFGNQIFAFIKNIVSLIIKLFI